MKRLLAWLVLSALILNSCSNEYLDYHKDQLNFKSESDVAAKEDVQFKIEDIEVRDLEVVWITPDKTLLEKLVSKIENAQQRVYLEVYILTEKRIIKSLKDAKQRWLDVRVIVEKNVYWAWNMNKKSFDALVSAWIDVRYANNWNYRYTHAKFFLIDDAYVISTGNMSFSTFAYNKDLLLFWNDKEDIAILEELFKKDSKWEKFIKCDAALVISPKCPREQFMGILGSAKESIYVYAETLDDYEIEALLVKKDKEWADVKILLWDINKIKSNKEPLERLQKLWINIIAPKKPYIHAKALFIDWKIAYVGSINFSTNSIENNREIWMIFKNDIIVDKLKNEFLTIFLNKQ